MRHILCCVICFGFFYRPVYPMLPVYLDCPFLIAHSVFSDGYLIMIIHNRPTLHMTEVDETWWVSYERKELLTLREHMSSPPRFLVESVLLFFLVFLCCHIVCLYVLISVLCYPLRFSQKKNKKKRCSVLFSIKLFVGGLAVSLCMFAYSDVKNFVLPIAFTFQVPCFDVRYDFRIKRSSVCLSLQLFVEGLMSLKVRRI